MALTPPRPRPPAPPTPWQCYPLFAAIGGGLVLCAFRLGHGLTHPEVRVAKEPRSGQDNMIEVDAPKAEAYRNHKLRRWITSRKQEIFPGMNTWGGDAKHVERV